MEASYGRSGKRTGRLFYPGGSAGVKATPTWNLSGGRPFSCRRHSLEKLHTPGPALFAYGGCNILNGSLKEINAILANVPKKRNEIDVV
jgi:hypothetical protein